MTIRAADLALADLGVDRGPGTASIQHAGDDITLAAPYVVEFKFDRIPLAAVDAGVALRVSAQPFAVLCPDRITAHPGSALVVLAVGHVVLVRAPPAMWLTPVGRSRRAIELLNRLRDLAPSAELGLHGAMLGPRPALRNATHRYPAAVCTLCTRPPSPRRTPTMRTSCRSGRVVRKRCTQRPAGCDSTTPSIAAEKTLGRRSKRRVPPIASVESTPASTPATAMLVPQSGVI